MGFLAPLAALAGSVGAGAGGALGGVGAATALGGTAAAAASTLGGLASAGIGLAGALSKPKVPGVTPPPTTPTFAAGLTGGKNQGLAALNPQTALGGTVSGSFMAPSGGYKTLLG